MCVCVHARLLGLGLGVSDLADVDGIGRVRDVALLLHVRGGDGQQRAVAAEGQRGDAGRVTVELTQTLLIERVPDVHEPVRATCRDESKSLTHTRTTIHLCVCTESHV